MKYFKGILVVFVVFFLPLGSYLYLRSGFNYRKQALEELKQENPLSDFQYETLRRTLPEDRMNRIIEGITLIQKVDSEKDKKDALFFAENLNVRPDFQLVTISDSEFASFHNDTTYSKTISKIQLDENSVSSFFSDNNYILMKDSLVRNTYGTSVDDTKKLYEHTVILLPVKKRDKVTLERESEI